MMDNRSRWKRKIDFYMHNCPRTSSMMFELSYSVRKYKLVKRGRVCDCVTLTIAVAVPSLLIKASMPHNSMGTIISVNDTLIPNPQSFTQITYHINSCFYAIQCLSVNGCNGVCYLLNCKSSEEDFHGTLRNLKVCSLMSGTLKTAPVLEMKVACGSRQWSLQWG